MHTRLGQTSLDRLLVDWRHPVDWRTPCGLALPFPHAVGPWSSSRSGAGLPFLSPGRSRPRRQMRNDAHDYTAARREGRRPDTEDCMGRTTWRTWFTHGGLPQLCKMRLFGLCARSTAVCCIALVPWDACSPSCNPSTRHIPQTTRAATTTRISCATPRVRP